MADVNFDPFGELDKTNSHPDETGENILFTPGGVTGGGSTWEPDMQKRHIIWRKNSMN